MRMAMDDLNAADHSSIVQAPLQLAETEEAARQQVEQLAAELVNPNANGGEESVEIPGSCQVCWEVFTSQRRQPVAMRCGHMICLQCLRSLAKLQCPKCREYIQFVYRIYP